MRRRTLAGLVLMILLGVATLARAEFFSKSYAFKPDTRLEIGVETADGVRIDSIRFLLPPGESHEPPRAEVEISNLGTKSTKVGLAIALLDKDQRLLGVASGGTKMFGLRSDRQIKYTLSFDAVYGEIGTATVFKIAIEPRS